MPDNKENLLRDSQLASIGKMLAGYTHELKNHLAIINESSGLMGDLLEMGCGGSEQPVERLKKIISGIGERIAQANCMAKHLNSFAHRMDLPISTFDVNILLEEELAFLDRFAKLKSVSLLKNLQMELPALSNNPSLLQFVIFTNIREMIACIDSGGEITVSSRMVGQDVTITIEDCSVSAVPSGEQDGQPTQASVLYALEKMGASKTEESGLDARYSITLTIPSI